MMKGRMVLLLLPVLVIYLCAGAALFQFLENEKEEEIKQSVEELIKQFTAENSCLDESKVKYLMRDVYNIAGRFMLIPSGNETKDITKWNFAGSFTYAVTVITTIGYGRTVPATTSGRVATMIYGLLGIPLMLIFLTGLAEQLAQLPNIVDRFFVRKCPVVCKVVNAVAMTVTGICLLFVVPSVVFSWMEGWSITEAIYFCFITLATIGFGDLSAGSAIVSNNDALQALYQVAVYVWIIVGLAYISLCFKLLSDSYMQKAAQARKSATKRLDMSQLFTIAGAFAHRENKLTTKPVRGEDNPKIISDEEASTSAENSNQRITTDSI